MDDDALAKALAASGVVADEVVVEGAYGVGGEGGVRDVAEPAAAALERQAGVIAGLSSARPQV